MGLRRFVTRLIFSSLAVLPMAAASTATAAPVHLGFNDTATNLQWGQITDFTNVSWNTLTAKCNPSCTAGESINGYDLTGWTLASNAQVDVMLQHFLSANSLTYPGFGIIRNSDDWRGPLLSMFTPTSSFDPAFGWDGLTFDSHSETQRAAYEIFVSSSVPMEASSALIGLKTYQSPSLGAWLYEASPVPEPASVTLVVGGLIGLATARRRRGPTTRFP